jgi:hypothetical protein
LKPKAVDLIFMDEHPVVPEKKIENDSGIPISQQ